MSRNVCKVWSQQRDRRPLPNKTEGKGQGEGGIRLTRDGTRALSDIVRLLLLDLNYYLQDIGRYPLYYSRTFKPAAL